MSFDGLMMHHLINEYQDSLIHHRIDNIIYVQTDVFALELYHQKQKNFLLLTYMLMIIDYILRIIKK